MSVELKIQWYEYSVRKDEKAPKSGKNKREGNPYCAAFRVIPFLRFDNMGGMFSSFLELLPMLFFYEGKFFPSFEEAGNNYHNFRGPGSEFRNRTLIPAPGTRNLWRILGPRPPEPGTYEKFWAPAPRNPELMKTFRSSAPGTRASEPGTFFVTFPKKRRNFVEVCSILRKTANA